MALGEDFISTKLLLVPLYAGELYCTINSFLKEKSDTELKEIVEDYESKKLRNFFSTFLVGKYAHSRIDYDSAKAAINMKKLGIIEFNPGPRVSDVLDELPRLEQKVNALEMQKN